jgi:DHA2 family lincomycin resistance protein-like MFS transporter
MPALSLNGVPVTQTIPSPATDSVPTTSARDATRRSGLVIGILAVSTFVVILNETIMGVALPTLMVDLNITASTAQWLTTGFLLTMAVVIPITGFLMQRFRTRQIYIAAMTLFSVGTLLAAVAPGFTVLLLGRIVQAMGTAIMLPLLMATAIALVPANRRGRTMGTISIVIAVAPAVGPTISGLILSVLSWRWMFIIVLPIALIALAIGAVKMLNVGETSKPRLDALSIVLSALGFGGVLYALSSLGEGASHEQAISPVVPAVVGVVALVLFVLRQFSLTRRSTPLLDLRAFGTRNFTFSIIMIAAASLVLFGSLIVLPMYLQSVLDINSLATGLLLLPGGLAMGLFSPIVGRLYDRVGPRGLLPIGAIVMSVALWFMASVLTVDTPVWMILIPHILLNIGLSFTFTPLFSAGLGSLDAHLYADGSAILNTVQQVMGGVGTALFITVMSTAAAGPLADGASTEAADAAGVHAAFLIGGVISLISIVISFFVRRPATTGNQAPITVH